MGYSIKLIGKNKKSAENLLSEVTTLLEKNSIDYCLEGGTLLGIYRENRLLPWDSDVDISILSNQLKNTDLIIKELNDKKYRVRIRKFEDDDFIFKKNKIRLIKVRKQYFFGLIKGTVCLEIFVKYIHENNVYWKVADKTMVAPKTFYDESKKIDFLDKKYFIPLKTDEYLTHKYGNWKTPVKNWNASKDELSIITK
jgi:lipopolysaccharide cholinephosphotransferase